MTKKYAALVAGDVNPIGMDPKGTRELWDSLTKDLEGNKDENQRGVQALTNWLSALSKEGQEGQGQQGPAEISAPSEPPLVEGTPSKDFGTAVREGLVVPTDLSKDLFKTATGTDMPGTGEISEQEMKTQDQWDGFRAANYQTGKEPGQMQSAILDEMGGREKPELQMIPMDQMTPGDDEMTWGPSKMVKGLLTMDPAEYCQGAMEALNGGLDVQKTMTDQLGLAGGPNLFKNMGKNLMESVIQGEATPEMKETLDSMKGAAANIQSEEMKAAFGDIKGQAEKLWNDPKIALEALSSAAADLTGGKGVGEIVGKALESGKEGLEKVSPALMIPSAMQKAVDGVIEMMQGQKGKKEKEEPEDPAKLSFVDKEGNLNEEFLNDFASKLSAAAAYKKCRKAGLNSKEAGMAGEAAGEVTQEATKTKGTTAVAAQALDKGVDAAKTAKDMAVKVASKSLAAIPGVGPALAVGLQAANYFANLAIDAAKEAGKEAVGPNQNTPGAPGAEQEQKPQEKPQGTEVKTQGPNAVEVTAELAGAGAGPGAGGGAKGVGGVKEALTKGKGKLLKQLLPAGDLNEGLIDSLSGMGSKATEGIAKTKDGAKTNKPPDFVQEMNG
jgi:hypothetical protein